MAKPKEIVKKFAVNLAASVATEIVRGYLNEQLKDVKPSDLYESITSDRDLWTVIPDDIKTTTQKFKKAYKNIFEKFEDQITTELILEWMKQDHLDLYSTIINIPDKKGVLWFHNQVQKIKEQIIYM